MAGPSRWHGQGGHPAPAAGAECLILALKGPPFPTHGNWANRIDTGGLAQQVHQPLNGGGFSPQLPPRQSAQGECYRGHRLGLVLYAWHFYPLVRKTMREPQSPGITIAPIQRHNKMEGSGKGLPTQNDQPGNNSTHPPRGRDQGSTEWPRPTDTATALPGKVNPTQRHHFFSSALKFSKAYFSAKPSVRVWPCGRCPFNGNSPGFLRSSERWLQVIGTVVER